MHEKFCGIYLLTFKSTGYFYIGQSHDIIKRYKEHLYKLKRGTHQPKIQNVYSKYLELPEVQILCECAPSELDDLENQAFEIYEVFNSPLGLNYKKESSYHGPSLPGEENKKAQYTKNTYILIFKEILKKELPLAKIAEKLNVNRNVVYQISSCSSHKWLEAEFPKEYQQLKLLKGRKGALGVLGSEKPKIRSPDGIVHEITNGLREFCKIHGLHEVHLGQVIKNNLAQHKGWTLP